MCPPIQLEMRVALLCTQKMMLRKNKINKINKRNKRNKRKSKQENQNYLGLGRRKICLMILKRANMKKSKKRRNNIDI